MEANQYERTYVSVYDAIRTTKYVNNVVQFLRQHSGELLLCKTIGLEVFGEEYLSNRSLQVTLGKILSHLRHGKFLYCTTTKGAPIMVEEWGWTPDPDEDGNQPYITVYDKEGNSYEIDNPRYKYTRRGHWGFVKRTITPTIKFYTWIED